MNFYNVFPRPLVMIARCRYAGTLAPFRLVATDACGIPLRPTWSIKELISSYPTPSLSPVTFQRLHELSALIPPAQGTHKYDTTKNELDELVRLVEAVKLVDVELPIDSSIADGRVRAEDTGISLTIEESSDEEVQSSDLLHHANRTLEGMYVVETNRER